MPVGLFLSLPRPRLTVTLPGVVLYSKEQNIKPCWTIWHAQVSYPYHIRVLIPCYKESLEIVGKTIQAAYNAPLPATVLRTIYLCDDGKDPKKRKWCGKAVSHPTLLVCLVCYGFLEHTQQVKQPCNHCSDCLSDWVAYLPALVFALSVPCRHT
jgi:cellulose synthase/poly-beta-1,6-N-acetylglucosamine synthase-like glycosyltransferase